MEFWICKLNNIPFDIYEYASNLGYLIYEIDFNKLEKFNIKNKSIWHFNFVYDNKKIIVINRKINELKKIYLLWKFFHLMRKMK